MRSAGRLLAKSVQLISTSVLRCDNALLDRNAGEALEEACYPSPSLTNQSIASSRVLNLRNSRWEKVVSAS